MKLPKVRGHKDVAQIVRERIRTQCWMPGTLIPSEQNLASEFECSRGTVNRALRDLEASGVVARRKRAGTRVRMNPEGRATLDIPLIKESVKKGGDEYRFAILEQARMQPPAAVRGRMQAATASKMLHLRTLHLAGHQPYIYEDRWINLDVVPEIEKIDLSAISANEWLVRNKPLSKGDIFFTARAATDHDAEALQVTLGTALFVIDRITWADQNAITSVTMAHAPGFRLHTKI